MKARSILIVDDNDKNRKLLRVILSQSGYRVCEAPNGGQGIEAARSAKPDLILMDYRMPVYDGIAATRILKTDPATSAIPVFIVTSSAMKGDMERITAQSGCDRLFSKPIDYREILAAVQQLFGE